MKKRVHKIKKEAVVRTRPIETASERRMHACLNGALGNILEGRPENPIEMLAKLLLEEHEAVLQR